MGVTLTRGLIGGLGVVLTSTGPGAVNAMAGLYEAQFGSSPLLMITGQIETRFLGKGKGFYDRFLSRSALRAIDVAMPPGCTTLSRVLLFRAASSCRNASEKPRTANFAAE